MGRQAKSGGADMCDVVLVDDHPMLAAGLVSGLTSFGLVLRTAPVLELTAVLEFIDLVQPRLVLLDFHVPPIGTSEVFFGPLHERGIGFAILTGHTDEALWGRLLDHGAKGIVSKSEPLGDVLEAIGVLVSSETFRPGAMARHREAWRVVRAQDAERLAPFRTLTAREAEVAAAMVRGEAPAQIAANSFVSVGTVRSQIKAVYRKLDVSSQLELVTLARKASWFGPTGDQPASEPSS